MSSRITVNHLLENFSSVLSIEPLRLDAAGVCAFEYEDGLGIAIEVPDGSSQVYLIGTLMPGPAHQAPATEAFYRKLLALNLFSPEIRGARVALDPQSGDVLLCYQHPVEALDGTGFYNLLTHFTQAAQALRAGLRSEHTDRSADAASPLAPAIFFNQRA